MTSTPPRSMLDKVREDLATLTESQRNSTEVLLVEHRAALVDNDPTVTAIRALRDALADLGIEYQPQTNSTVDEIQARRARRHADAASSDRDRPAARDDRR